MLSMKGIGQATIFVGILISTDAGIGGIPGLLAALVAIFVMLLGVPLIRLSKPKPKY
jgi:hypothetical protein